MTFEITINTNVVFLVSLVGFILMRRFLSKYEKYGDRVEGWNPRAYGEWWVRHGYYEYLSVALASVALLSGFVSLVELISGGCFGWDFNAC